jgi:transposase-like protein
MYQKSNLSSSQNEQVKELLSLLNTNPYFPLLTLFTELLNSALLKERSSFLQKSPDPENKANGFYQRELLTSIGKLNLKVPRDRKGLFRSSLLPPPYARAFPEDYKRLILSLILDSYSPNSIKTILERLELPFSYEVISEIKGALLDSAAELNSRPLREEYLAVFIDAYQGNREGLIKDEETRKIRKAAIYVVIGITMSGEKTLLGYYVNFGNENKDTYLSIFNNLVDRGLKKVLIFVTDNFSGIKEAIKEIFPLSDHQICLLHLKRNIRLHMPKKEANELIAEIEKIEYETDYEIAVSRFEQAISKYKDRYSTFMKHLEENKENYFMFIKYPEGVRKYLYTTNIVENFNSLIEKERINRGGYFASQKTAECIIYLIYKGLTEGRWRRPIPEVVDAQYELLQMFNLRFSNAQTQKS